MRHARPLLAVALLTVSVGLNGAHRIEPLASEPVASGLERIGRDAEPPAPEGLLEQALSRLQARLDAYPQDYEASLLKGLILFRTGDREGALEELRRLTERAPKFHLAHLIHGDLLLTATRPVSDIGVNPLLARLEPTEKGLVLLRDEADARLRAYLDTLPQGRIPRALLSLAPATPTAIVVDKGAHRLYVYRRDDAGVPRLIKDLYVSTGKRPGDKLVRGDLKTPEGVYFVTSHIPAEKLTDEYGAGAFPINYPNELDRRRGKTGYGIWLHGTETGYYSRPPLDSEGCVVLPNIDLKLAARYIEPGVTPVVIAERLDWLEQREWADHQRELAAALEAWRRDWESLDTDAYLGHYAEGFWSAKHDLASWRAHKRRVAAGKSYQRIDLEGVSLFGYPPGPDGREIVVADFRQRYRSNNFESDMAKRLYLVREAGAWKILYEGPG